MTLTQRILVAATIVLVDAIAVVLPLTALLAAYVIIFNPSWFKTFAQQLDDSK